ncbi:BRCA1-associated protein [Zerene cesonia]|uniref:BRCA1-associated protein n=1 Tax=Zerene cesonia TaxID=33412 RepID=UPI0018E4E629|nr:BRCA1-associated protein [Zerene cesonia]
MSVSLCVLRIEIDEDLPEMDGNPTEKESATEQKKKDRGARESKTITVETYASVLNGPNAVSGILPTSSRRSPPEGSTSDEDDTISFFCGNPLIEVTKGVLHLYKENELKEAEEAKTLCLLSVPGALGAPDLLAFAAACQQDIAHVRVLRDGSPDHYMALLTFRTSAAAREFHSAFDGVPYSSLEPAALCHTAWVSRVEYARDGAAPPSHTELPTCPVCLERMDESVAGVLSVQCAHSFHAECLMGWRDARCPVCRCAQTPEPRDSARCLQCDVLALEAGVAGGAGGAGEAEAPRDSACGVAEGLLEAEAGTLWICLICGHVGCGRYEKGHAAKHFMQSNHTYALQLGSNRVWDYAGDNFVHRLVQNKADGKLVAAEGAAADPEPACADKLEFTYLLTHHLDTQRHHYEERLAKLERERLGEAAALRAGAAAREAAAAALRRQLAAARADNKALAAKLHALTTRVSKLQNDLSEERSLSAALAERQAQWQAREAQWQAKEDSFRSEVAELKEQLRDVMFFVEARNALQSSSAASPHELQAATVALPPAPPAPPAPSALRSKTMSRVAGVAPISFGPSGVRVSKPIFIYSLTFIIGLNVIILTGFSVDISEPRISLRANTLTETVCWVLNLCVVSALSVVGCVGAPARCTCFIDILHKIHKVVQYYSYLTQTS